MPVTVTESIQWFRVQPRGQGARYNSRCGRWSVRPTTSGWHLFDRNVRVRVPVFETPGQAMACAARLQ